MDSNDRSQRVFETLPSRRRVLLAGASVSTALLAGCTGTTDDTGDDPTDGDDGTADGEDETDGSDGDSGDGPSGSNFRLLVSDMPADIGDFDRLDVTLDSARIFDGEEETEDEESSEESEESEDEESSEESEESEDEESSEESEESDDGGGEESGEADEDSDKSSEDDSSDESEAFSEDDGGGSVIRDRGFYVLDLDDPTVDLTQVVGDRAIPVFEGELSEGAYRKIELYVADVEGIVDGEEVEVKVPSGKLQITTPFEIRADSTVDFVFDINVVKRGKQARYNLTPVISGSGVAGKDVSVEEVDDDEDDSENETDGTDGSSEDGTDEDDTGSEDGWNGEGS